MKNQRRSHSAGMRLLGILLALVMVVGFLPATRASAAVGQEPEHHKNVTPKGDGTYQIELTVKGDSDTTVTTAANVNVIIVYDVSQSMTTNVTGTNFSRADNAEDIVHDFVEGLRRYQNTSNPSNIEVAVVTFGPNASIRQGWTSDLSSDSGVNRFFDDGVDRTVTSSHNYGSNFGTNWDHAFRQANSLLGALDARENPDTDPTFVLFVTDGVCTKLGDDNTMGDNPSETNWTNYREYYEAAAASALTVESRPNTTIFGVYAYGTEHDLLDDVIYYANEGKHREMTVGGTTYTIMGVPVNQYNTFNFGETDENTEHYFNAADTTKLNEAIESVFQTIVSALGVSQVAIQDGTTSNVEASGKVVDLVTVIEGSYKYWLSIPVVDNQYKRINMVSGEEETFTVTDNNNGTCTVTWGESNTFTVQGKVANNQFKYQWTGSNALYSKAPPEAQLNGSTVDWTFPENFGALLNGVTYSVTFDVYPTQTTLDYIADIANNPGANGAWKDLPGDVKTYIHDDGSFDTNTEATISWVDTRPGGTSGGPVGFTENESQKAETVEQLTVSKEWENELDSQGAKPLTLIVTRDDDPAYTLTLPRDVIDEETGETEKVWDNKVFISIGIMRTKDDGTMEILASGHDFTFKEPEDLTYHWELDVPTVRPMQIDGEVTMLIKEDGKHQPEEGTKEYTIDGETYYVGSTGEAALTATNHRRSSLLLTKVVDGEGAPADATFPFTLNVVDFLAPETKPEDDPGHDTDYWVWISVRDKNGTPIIDGVEGESEDFGIGLDKDGQPNGWYYTPSGTNVTIPVQAGYSIRVNNLPTKSTYTITEGTLPEAFTFVSSELTNEEGEGEDSTFSGGRTTTGTIEATNTLYKVTYTNKYELVNVTVDKVWEDADDQDGIRPESVSVQLLADGEPYGDPVTLQAAPVEEDGDDTTGQDANESPDWSYTWTGLPKKADGQVADIVYTVEELDAEELEELGYSSEISGNAASGFTITNSHTPETIDVTVIKEWDDADDQDGIRPESVSVQLLADGEPCGEAVLRASDNNGTASKNTAGNWTYTWEGLPKNAGGTAITYSVDEIDLPAGYTSTSGDPEVTDDGISITVTNQHTPGETTVTVTKEWDDEDDQDHIRPESIQVQLYKNGEEYGDPVTLPYVEADDSGEDEESGNETEKWSYTWTGLPQKVGGEDIEYTVQEVTTEVITGKDGPGTYEYEVTGSAADGFTITNTHTPTTIDIVVYKVWVDGGAEDRPEALELTLNGLPDKIADEQTETFRKDGETSAQEEWPRIEVSKDDPNTWIYTWWAVPANDESGEPIEYTVTEEEVPEGYVCETTTVENGGTITNVKTETITVTKVWDDNNDQDKKRPDSVEFTVTGSNGKTYTVTLPAEEPEQNGTNVGDAQRSKANDDGNTWTADLEVDKYWNNNGTVEEVTYTVDEFEVEGYETDIDNETLTITNSYDPESTTVSVKKVWDDNSNQDGKRPETLELTLNGAPDGFEVPDPKIQKSNDGNTWTYTWSGLPKNDGGEEIEYTVSEDEKAAAKLGYECSGSPAKNGGTITNTHVPETEELTVTKIWDDEGDFYGKRPDSVELTVTGSDGETYSVTLRAPEGDQTGANDKTNETAARKADGANEDAAEADNAYDVGADTWTGTVKVAKYSKGQEVTFTVDETTELPDGYVKKIDNETLTITNEYNPEMTNLTLKKVWEDEDNKYNVRPESITVNLLLDGEVYESAEITEAEQWTCILTVPKELNFTVEEDAVTNYPESKIEKNGDGTIITITNYIDGGMGGPGEGHLTINKETTSTPANGKTYALGEEITYKITVTNDGDLEITNITVTDALTGDEWTIASLEPGEYKEFETNSYTVTEADILNGQVLNVATATGDGPDPDEPVKVDPGEDPEPTEDKNGHLTIKKETTSKPANNKTYALGEEIAYKITVTNDGNLTITDITVTDELTGDTWTIASLAPNGSKVFKTSYKVTATDVQRGYVENVATAKGTSPDPDEPDVPVTPGTKRDDTKKPTPTPPPEPPVLNKKDHFAYIIGDTDGLVHPNDSITRAEVATIFFRLLTDESRASIWTKENDFSDVNPEDWFNNAISTMAKGGILKGYPDGTFGPRLSITRAEFATIAVRFFEELEVTVPHFTDTKGHWAEAYINMAADQGLINGYPDDTYRPDAAITRAEAMTIINRLLERHPHKDYLLDDMIQWPDNMNTGIWYYADVQEATNSHDYVMSGGHEVWKALLPVRDWAAFENEWSTAYSAYNPGDVISEEQYRINKENDNGANNNNQPADNGNNDPTGAKN